MTTLPATAPPHTTASVAVLSQPESAMTAIGREGAGDEQEDGGVVETAQPALARADQWPRWYSALTPRQALRVAAYTAVEVRAFPAGAWRIAQAPPSSETGKAASWSTPRRRGLTKATAARAASETSSTASPSGVALLTGLTVPPRSRGDGAVADTGQFR